MNADLTRKLDQLTAHCDGVVAATRKDKIIVYADEKAHKTTGYKFGALVGESLNVLMPGRLKYLHDDLVDKYMETAGETSRDMTTQVVAAKQQSGRMRELQIVIQSIDNHAIAALFHLEDRMALFRTKRDAL